MAAKLTQLTHKLAIQLHLVVESCTIFSTRCRRLFQKILDTPSYVAVSDILYIYIYIYFFNWLLQSLSDLGLL
jgi:hypothetical protein